MRGLAILLILFYFLRLQYSCDIGDSKSLSRVLSEILKPWLFRKSCISLNEGNCPLCIFSISRANLRMVPWFDIMKFLKIVLTTVYLLLLKDINDNNFMQLIISSMFASTVLIFKLVLFRSPISRISVHPSATKRVVYCSIKFLFPMYFSFFTYDGKYIVFVPPVRHITLKDNPIYSGRWSATIMNS